MAKKILDMFRMDLRMIGIFRILLGILVICDLINRLFDLELFYTDDGVFPRSVLLQHDWYNWNFSLNMVTGSWDGQLLIFLAGIFSALMVVIGYRAKLFAFFAFLIVVSIQTRNPQITHGGDTVLRLLLFYSLFLPISARYAVDRFEKVSLPAMGKILSVATVVYILQVISVYIFAGIGKTGAEWYDGSAVYYALSLEMYATPLTQYLVGFPSLTSLLTYFTIFLEKFGFILLFIPFAWKYFRLAGVMLFMSLHIGFILFMNLGIFPWAALVMWVLLFPPMVAEFLEERAIKTGVYQKVKNYRDRLRVLLTSQRLKLPLPVKNFQPLGAISSLFLIAIAIGTLVWNINNLGGKQYSISALQSLSRVTNTYQQWNMFAPTPMRNDGWFVMDAQLRNGKHVDILNNADEVNFEKPLFVRKNYRSTRFHKYLLNRNYKQAPAYMNAWGRYYCKCWNKENENTPKELESFSIYFMREYTPEFGQPNPEPEKRLLWNYWCKDEFKTRFTQVSN